MSVRKLNIALDEQVAKADVAEWEAEHGAAVRKRYHRNCCALARGDPELMSNPDGLQAMDRALAGTVRVLCI